MKRRTTVSTLFPYTTLFRSLSFASAKMARISFTVSRSRRYAETSAFPGRSCGRLSGRSEEHTSELQSHSDLVCRLLLEKKKHTSEVGKRVTTVPWKC